MEEIWKPVIDWEDVYEASDLGNIRKKKSKRHLRPSFGNKYPHVTLSRNRFKKTIRVHRLIAKAFHPMIEGKTHVNHINGNTRDNRASNLEWVSQQENNVHSYEVLGNISPMLNAERVLYQSPSSKVKSKQQVLQFDRLNSYGMSAEKIGRIFNLNGSTVRKHLRRLRTEDL